METEADGEDECAICFEPVHDIVKLPCACKVVYCLQCWDHALAESFNGCGEARCPTCRLNIRVDFISEAGRLVFSPATAKDDESSPSDNPEDVGTEDGRDRFQHACRIERRARRARRRLIRQACPAQIKLIKQHGASALAQVFGDRSAQQAVSAIPCVCGGKIERISVRERIARCLHPKLPAQGVPPDEFDRVIAYFMQREQPCASCDICGSCVFTTSSAIWTCTAGSSTVLHSNSYDICEGCMSRYTTADDSFTT